MIGNTKKGSVWSGTKAAVWGLSILVLVFGFALVGCGGDDDDDDGGGGGGIPAEFVGTWTGVKSGSPSTSVSLTIDTSGTYSLICLGGVSVNATGKFRVEGGNGILRHPSDTADYGNAVFSGDSLGIYWPTLGSVSLSK